MILFLLTCLKYYCFLRLILRFKCCFYYPFLYHFYGQNLLNHCVSFNPFLSNYLPFFSFLALMLMIRCLCSHGSLSWILSGNFYEESQKERFHHLTYYQFIFFETVFWLRFYLKDYLLLALIIISACDWHLLLLFIFITTVRYL